MKNTIGALMVAVSAVAFAASASAMEYKPYVGLDYVRSNVKDNAGMKFNSAAVNVGTQYNKYFGTEVFYQFSDQDSHGRGDEKALTRYQSYGLDAMGYLPLGCEQAFSLVGTAGISEIHRTAKAEGTKYKDSGYGYRLGAGAQYAIDENLAVRALARYTWADKLENVDHIMEYTAGVQYKF